MQITGHIFNNYKYSTQHSMRFSATRSEISTKGTRKKIQQLEWMLEAQKAKKAGRYPDPYIEAQAPTNLLINGTIYPGIPSDIILRIPTKLTFPQGKKIYLAYYSETIPLGYLKEGGVITGTIAWDIMGRPEDILDAKQVRKLIIFDSTGKIRYVCEDLSKQVLKFEKSITLSKRQEIHKLLSRMLSWAITPKAPLTDLQYAGTSVNHKWYLDEMKKPPEERAFTTAPLSN